MISSNRSLLTQLSALSGLLLAETNAGAQIMYTDLEPDGIAENVSYPYDADELLDIDGDGSDDVEIFVSHFSTTGWTSQAVVIKDLTGSWYFPVATGPLVFSVLALNSGDMVSAYSILQNEFGLIASASLTSEGPGTYGNIWGNFFNTTNKFLPLVKKEDGNTYYGWIRLSVLWEPRFKVVIDDFALQSDAFAPLAAGEGATETLCEAPLVEGTEHITSSSAKLNWEAVDDADKYQVYWRYTTATTWNKVIAHTHQKTLNDLFCGAEIEWKVRAGCSPLTYSAFSATQVFNTLLCRLGDTETPIVNLYPDPATDRIYLQYDMQQDEILQLAVISAEGSVLKEWRFTDASETTELDLTGLPAGYYILKGFTGERSFSKSFMRQ